MDGWKTILSFWVSAYFQKLLLLVSGSGIIAPKFIHPVCSGHLRSIGSMNGLPTFTIQINHSCVYIYTIHVYIYIHTIHGSYGIHLKSSFRLFIRSIHVTRDPFASPLSAFDLAECGDKKFSAVTCKGHWRFQKDGFGIFFWGCPPWN